MIEFGVLEIENFLAIKEGTMDLRDRGLVLIEGVNRDDSSASSNGAGKSSIVDAISWCLYGVTARKARGDAIVNVQAGKGTRVAVYLQIDGEEYRIERGRKHPKLKNRVKVAAYDVGTGEYSADITQGTDDATQRMIDQMLGCNAEVFNASIYMGQERMVDLPSLTDKDLKTLIEESLGLSVMDDAHALAKKELEKESEQARSIGRQLDKLRAEADSEDENSRRLLEACNEAKDELSRLEKQYKTEHELLEDLKKTYASASGMLGELKDMKALHKEEIDAAFDRIKRIEDKVNALNREHQHGSIEIDRVKARRDTLVQSLKALDDGTKCPTCGAECSAPHDLPEQEAKLQERLVAIEKDIIARQKDIDSLATKIRRGKELADEGHAKWSNLRMEQVVKESELQARIDQVTKHGPGEIARQAKHVDFVRNMERNKTDQVERIVREGIASRMRFNEISDNITAHEHDIEEVVQREKSMTNVVHALSRKGFRGEVLDQITPYLNMRTDHYLSELTDGNITASWETIRTNAAGDYVESFRIEIKHKSGVDSFNNLSGGEKRKVRLATSLALQDLVATRAVKPIKLFVADEIDDAIDASGLELLMGLLEQKGRDMGTVFVISHNDIAHMCANTLTVTKEHGVSSF